jgi:hypothetical protein
MNPIIRSRTRYFRHTYPLHVTILFTHIRLGLPSGLFPSGFPTNILYSSYSPLFVLHSLLISSSLVILLENGKFCYLHFSDKILIVRFMETGEGGTRYRCLQSENDAVVMKKSEYLTSSSGFSVNASSVLLNEELSNSAHMIVNYKLEWQGSLPLKCYLTIYLEGLREITKPRPE